MRGSWRFTAAPGGWRLMARSVVAILGGAAISAVTATVLLFISSALAGNPTADSGSLPIVLASWVMIAFIGNFIAALTLGMAWRWVAEANRWRASWQYWMPAAVCGFALAFLFINAGALVSGEAHLVWRWFQGMLPAYLYGAALGGFTALFAWLIRRPDRDAAPNPPRSAP